MLHSFRFLIFIVITNIFLFSCSSNEDSNSTASKIEKADQQITTILENGNNNQTVGAKLQFKKVIHDFGKVYNGEKLVYSFKFMNVGDEPLIIYEAFGSCGCTVPKVPKEPIIPGDSSTIEVTFNSTTQRGIVEKTVTILSNAKPSKNTIKIKASVIKTE